MQNLAVKETRGKRSKKTERKGGKEACQMPFYLKRLKISGRKRSRDLFYLIVGVLRGGDECREFTRKKVLK